MIQFVKQWLVAKLAPALEDSKRANFALESELAERQQALLALTTARDRLELAVREREAESNTLTAALRKSEASLRLAQQIGQVGSWEADVNGHHVNWSDECFRIFGFDPAAFAPSVEAFLALIHPEDAANVRQAASEFIRAGTLQRIEPRIVRPDGAVRTIRILALAVEHEAGQPKLIAGALQDVTAQQSASRAREKLELQLRQAQKMETIGALAGGIAHDFNNILGSIIGYTEVAMADAPAGALVNESLIEVLRAGKRARDLVKQILAFSRKQEPERRFIHVQPVIQEALKLLRPTLPAQIEIRTRLETETRVVLADPGQLHQVLMNLCTNAAHALGTRGGELAVATSLVPIDADWVAANPDFHESDYLRISVADTGIGMTPETIERIFEPLFTTKEPGQGTGLGLAVVHGIVRAHDGIITVESSLGRGTTFHVYLPAFDQGTADSEPTEPPPPRGQGERILYVDDEMPLTSVVIVLLSRLGYSVSVENDPLSALAAFRNQPDRFDLVVTDLNMPGINGLDFGRELLHIRASLPIILVTGYTATLDAGRVRKLGFRDLLMKPFTIEALASALHRILRPADRTSIATLQPKT